MSVHGVLGYLPQSLPLDAGTDRGRGPGHRRRDRARWTRHRVRRRGEEHFTTIGNDWDIEERTRAQLDRLGLGDLALAPASARPSGGQVVSLGLAAQLLQAARRPAARRADQQPRPRRPPQALRRARRLERLPAAGQPRPGAARPDGPHRRTRRGEIRFYGGNFTEYEEAVAAAQEVAEKNIRNAEQEVKREKREMQQARERAARRAEQRRAQPQERRPAEDLRR